MKAFPMRSHLATTRAIAATVLTALRVLPSSNAGGIATIFALLAPVLFMVGAAAIDYGLFERDRIRLQAQVDAAAIASAREMQMAKADGDKIAAVAENYVRHAEPLASVQTTVNAQAMSVTVSAARGRLPVARWYNVAARANRSLRGSGRASRCSGGA